MKKNKCRLVSYLKMLRRGGELKEFLLSILMNFIKGTWDFFRKSFNVVRYPQYSLFGIELIFFLGLILYSIILALPIFNLEVIKSIFNLVVIKPIFNFEVIKLIFNLEVKKSILNIFNLCFLAEGLFLAVKKFILQKNIDYGGIKEQLNDTGDEGEILKTTIPKFFSKFHYYFFILPIILLFYNILSIGNTFINDLGIFFAVILLVFELSINSLAFSPYLFILMIAVITTIVHLIGSNTTFLNWSFLTLIFITLIGENFFEDKLVKKLFSKISEENLILRKISINIGVVFLYFGIILSERIVNSTFYYISFISEASFPMTHLRIFIAKSLIFTLVFAVYFGTEKKIMYLIFRFYYRDKTLKNSNSVVKVSLDEEKRWKVKRVKKKPKDLERIGINTYKLKKHNVIYVDKSSEIPEKIKGLREAEGKLILGLVPSWTNVWLILMIFISPTISFLNYIVKIDDGIYKIEEKPDKAEVPNEIEVLGDAIVYNGKVEAFDTHTQSFEHGTISIRKKDKHSIELTKNVGDKTKVVYQKMDANGIPIKLQEKYTGHSENSGYDGLIFSEGNSTLIFDKKDNKITNKTENHTEPFVVIPEDKLDGEAKGAFNKHKSEYKGAYFIFTANKKYDKDSSNVYVAVLSDGGKTIQINELEYSGKDDDSLYRFTGKAE